MNAFETDDHDRWLDARDRVAEQASVPPESITPEQLAYVIEPSIPVGMTADQWRHRNERRAA